MTLWYLAKLFFFSSTIVNSREEVTSRRILCVEERLVISLVRDVLIYKKYLYQV